MSNQWSTKPSGPWDEKYLDLDPGNPNLRTPGPTEPIFYPQNPGDPYIMKPVSHSWADISGMIVQCANSRKDITSRPIYYQLCQSIYFNRDPNIILLQFKEIYNHLFFGGMVETSTMKGFVDDEVKIIFSLEIVSDRARAAEVGLNDALGLTTGFSCGRFQCVTIYILDRRTQMPGWNYFEVIIEMLGTLAHEMIHAMELMYTKYRGEKIGIAYAPHGAKFQKAAQAIEQATGYQGWTWPVIELGRDWSVVCDVFFYKYKEPTDTEFRNMGLDAEKIRKILHPRTTKLIDQPSDFE
ncbi:hypothetical protein BOTCAL_0532g00030 [Botryotinia calthae]|uniref:Uncharacterized protein n=1 Tax=Botryotinia calthae TaxID=38488 RepID=A0A4Y8CKJ9_9HELO|nr:hypothetical protein BOTCAL_0532g00030 [Botryotinia calthae]